MPDNGPMSPERVVKQMADTNPVASPTPDAAAAAAAKAAKAAEKAVAKAAEKAAKEASKVVANGVTRPKDGTQTGKVWTISDDISKNNGKPAERKEVLAVAAAQGINEATAATQYGKWRKFHGLKSEPRAPRAEKAPAGSDVSTQAAPTA